MSGLVVRIERVDELDCRVETYDWRFAREQAAEIRTHWQGLVAARPKMFDGRVLLMHRCDVEVANDRRVMRSGHFEVDFSAFIAWRDFGFPDMSVRNCFAMAALRGADGGFVLAEMGAHTANAGKIYFPAGTPDPHDIHNGKLDFSASVLRELHEETGLGAQEVSLAPGWTLVHAGPRLGVLKTVYTDAPAREIARDLDARIARQAQPELARMHVVEGRADITPGAMPEFIVAYLEHMLAGARGRYPG